MPDDELTCREVWEEVADLLMLRLHQLPQDAPGRGQLAELTAQMHLVLRLPAAASDADQPSEAAPRLSLRRRWRQTPQAGRETLVLEAMRQDQLTAKEIAGRVTEALGAREHGDPIYADHVRPLLNDLAAQGRVDRTVDAERGRPVYVYTRSSRLQGPIADLERAFHDEAHEEA